MSTLASRKQSKAIRDRMRMIRSDLPYSVDSARNEVKQLADWKYYVRSFPLTSVIGTAAVAFMAVPKRSSNQTSRNDKSDVDAKPSLVEGLIAAVAATALRSGMSLAANQLSSHFTGQNQGGLKNPAEGQSWNHSERMPQNRS